MPGTTPSRPLADYAGTYPSDLYGTATVTLENGGLVLRLLPNPDLVADLTHWHLDTFHLKWRNEFPWFADGKAQFVLDNRGAHHRDEAGRAERGLLVLGAEVPAEGRGRGRPITGG